MKKVNCISNKTLTLSFWLMSHSPTQPDYRGIWGWPEEIPKLNLFSKEKMAEVTGLVTFYFTGGWGLDSQPSSWNKSHHLVFPLIYLCVLITGETESFQIVQFSGKCTNSDTEISLLTFSTYFNKFFQRPWKKLALHFNSWLLWLLHQFISNQLSSCYCKWVVELSLERRTKAVILLLKQSEFYHAHVRAIWMASRRYCAYAQFIHRLFEGSIKECSKLKLNSNESLI